MICTPFEYALVKRGEVSGVRVASGFGADAIAMALMEASRDGNYASLTAAIFAETRGWTWRKSGALYAQELSRVAQRW